MLPPNSVCSDAPMLPTMLRERTTIPRTTPRLLTVRWPGSSKAVVTSFGLMAGIVLSWLQGAHSLVPIVSPRRAALPRIDLRREQRHTATPDTHASMVLKREGDFVLVT